MKAKNSIKEKFSIPENFTLGESIVTIAKLGGYLNRGCDGPPGFQALWRGHARLQDMVYAVMLREGMP